jgi:hypothetical protein
MSSLDASIYNQLVAGGLTPIAASGVIGNLQQESGTNLTEPGGLIAQWGGARLTAESAYAKSMGFSPTSQQGEIGYLLDELHGGAGAAENDSSVLSAINNASTPSQAATIFSQQYERPGTPDLSNRQSYAEDFYKIVKDFGGSGTLPTSGAPINIGGGVASALDGAAGSAADATGIPQLVSTAEGASNDISSVSGLVSDITGKNGLLTNLNSPIFWLRVVGIVGAVALLIFGLIELAGGHPVSYVGQAGQAAAAAAVA